MFNYQLPFDQLLAQMIISTLLGMDRGEVSCRSHLCSQTSFLQCWRLLLFLRHWLRRPSGGNDLIPIKWLYFLRTESGHKLLMYGDGWSCCNFTDWFVSPDFEAFSLESPACCLCLSGAKGEDIWRKILRAMLEILLEKQVFLWW